MFLHVSTNIFVQLLMHRRLIFPKNKKQNPKVLAVKMQTANFTQEETTL